MGSKLRRAGTVFISLAITTCCANVAAAEERSEEERERYAINLASTMKGSDLTKLASQSAFARHRVYATRFEKDGAVWQRLRIGFFSTRAEALEVAASLEDRFPDAWVTRVSEEEWRRFGQRPDDPTPEPAAVAVADPSADTTPPSEISATMTRPADGGDDPLAAARSALRDGDHERTLELTRPILSSENDAERADALELTGMAVERAGDLDGAASFYARYLEEYPDSEGTERVRQRLASLETAGNPVIPVLRQPAPSDVSGWEVDGALDQWYRHSADVAGPEGRRVTGSLLSNGLRLGARHHTEHTDTRLRLDGAYVADFDDRTSGELQAREIYVDFDDHRLDFSARVGRQRRNRDGVLGRFDGGAFGYRLSDVLKLNAVGGLPVDYVADGLDTDRYFYGLSLDIGPFDNGWDFNVYGIDQFVEGLTDRTAIGGEMRYADLHRSLYGLVDYDISYNELNTALLLGTWAFADRVSVDLTLEHQLTPILTTSNALIGEPADSIDELLQTLTVPEVRRLARDRTAISRALRIGGSYPLGDRLRLRGDFSVSHLSRSAAEREFEGSEGTGTEFRYGAQLISNDLLKYADLHILSLDYFQARRGDAVSLALDAAYPFDLTWFFKPSLRIGYRNGKDGDADQLTVGFAPRLDYLLREDLRLHLEVGAEWASATITGENGDAYGYFLEAGYRWSF